MTHENLFVDEIPFDLHTKSIYTKFGNISISINNNYYFRKLKNVLFFNKNKQIPEIIAYV